MTLSIKYWRAWRIAKRVPSRAGKDWLRVFTNEGELFGFALAVLTSYIGLRTASIPQIFAEAEGWMDALQAFVYVVLGWAAICLIRAPFVLLHEERSLGVWYGQRYVYHKPKLVKSFRCKATGQPQFHHFKFDDAEPESFVYFEIEVDGEPPRKLYSASVVCDMVLIPQDTVPGKGASAGGVRIGKGKEASLLMVMDPAMNSQTVRVYIKDFSIGNPEDKDGEEGEYRGAFRRPPR